jgi:hypothetical protein
MLERIKSYLMIFLAVIIVIFYAYTKIQQHINQKQQDKIETLDKNLIQLVEIAGNLLTEKYRNKDGSIGVRRTYIPPEGKVTVTQTADNKVTVKIKKMGLCLKPGIGIVWNKHPLLLSTKIAYLSRLGLIINGGYKTLGVGISRHLDDAFFGWKPQNLEAFISYHPMIFEQGSQRWFIGLRLSL